VDKIGNLLIRHCSPTLASLKTAGLFNYGFASRDEFEQSLHEVNRQLNGKGVFLEAVRAEDARALILVYRESKLSKDLQNDGVAKFLSSYGYQNSSVAHCVGHLKHRLAHGREFPHEIGIFLGYPLEDVIGFIENAGQNSKCTGCWKVYSDECEAMKLFEKYRKCKRIYQKLFYCGKTVMQLTVAA
jgi:hypothetical protein